MSYVGKSHRGKSIQAFTKPAIMLADQGLNIKGRRLVGKIGTVIMDSGNQCKLVAKVTVMVNVTVCMRMSVKVRVMVLVEVWMRV